jgi:hypothetical protein
MTISTAWVLASTPRHWMTMVYCLRAEAEGERRRRRRGRAEREG